MAGRADGALAPAYVIEKDWRKQTSFLPLLILYFGCMPIADVVAGALSAFYELNGFAVVYKAAVVLLLLLLLIAGRVSTRYGLIALGVIVLLIAGAGLRQSLGLGGMRDDLLFIARGPILFSAAVVMMMSLEREELRKLANVYFLATWVITSGSITITNWLGISLTTYDAGYGARGFYTAANEVTLGYVLSWWYVLNRIFHSRFNKIIVTAITIYVIYTIGTKSGFVLIPLLLYWNIVDLYKISWKISLVLFSVVCYFVMLYASSIFLAVLPYLPAADTFGFFIDTYGVETALTGGRFYQIEDIIKIISRFSWTELLFGIGFQNFWFAIDGNSVESDLIDVFGGGGIIFAAWFYGLLIWGYMISKRVGRSGNIVDTEWAIVFLAVIMYSIFVGHVAFAATPLVTIAFILALAYKERTVARRPSALLV